MNLALAGANLQPPPSVSEELENELTQKMQSLHYVLNPCFLCI